MKRIIAALLCAALALSLAACGGRTASGDTDTKDFLKAMDDLCASGDSLAQQGLSLQAESYYAFAGSSVSSLRYAVEYILWLKGEGDTLDGLAAESRYAGWDSIASVCYASPYPYYFEGLLWQIQGENDKAKTAYENTLLNPAYPEDGVDFYYLRNMEIDALYSLRDELRDKEAEIYGKYAPAPVSVERDPYLFDTEYLRAKSAEAMEAGDYATAAAYGKNAVLNDPLDPLNFRNAVLCCVYNDEGDHAAAYLDAGLVIAPEDEGLQTLYNAFSQIGGGAE